MRLLSVICQEFGSWAPWIKIGETVYIAMCSYAEKDIPKEAGFAFNKEKKMWFTNDFDKAALLSDYAEGDLHKELSARKVRLALSEEKSRCETSDIILRHPEKFNYYPFQYAGIDYMLHAFYENGTRRGIRGVILGDDMGLGKTVQIIGLWNNDESIKNCLIICPKTLKYNWFNEFKRWDVRGAKVGIGDTNIVPLPEYGYNVCIINYEAVVKQNKALSAVKWNLIGIDEAHNLKNEKSQRVKSIFGGSSKGKSKGEETTKAYSPIEFDKVIFATGTPIPNRVMEMWPLITKCDPDRWNSNTMWKFISRYCGGNPKGAAADDKLNELQKILRQTIMVRRLKKDVLKELPAKVRQVVELEYSPNDSAVKAALNRENDCSIKNEEELFNARVRMELAKASDNEDEYREAVANITSVAKIAFQDMAEARYQTAIAKIPYALDFCDNLLETTKKILIFAHHKDVLNACVEHYGTGCMVIHGDIDIKARQAAVDRFQSDPDCRVAVLSIKAAGVGITLTASSTVVFLELDWVPGNMTQCEDRVLRIGQTADVVNVYQLVLHNSIDVNMAHKIIEKQLIIEQTLDKVSEQEPVIISADEPATSAINKIRIESKLKDFDITLIPEIHDGLRIVAGFDQDFARAKNNVGFNAIDCRIGHSLAERFELTPKQAILGMQILKKYRKQIPFNIYYNIFKTDEKLEQEEF